MRLVAEVPVSPAEARVYEEGWQSWSPSATYRLDQAPHRPASATGRLLAFPSWAPPTLPGGFWGCGTLAVDPGDGGPVHLLVPRDPIETVPSLHAEIRDDRVLVCSSGQVDHFQDARPGGLEGALARWADRVARRVGVGGARPAPRLWCSWYEYRTRVTEADVVENLDAVDDLGLGVDVIQIDDGYQAAVGDWLTSSDGFGSLASLVARIRDRGRRAGIWIAPFLVAPAATREPAWLLRDAHGNPVHAGHHWGQDLFALDVTHPGAAGWLSDVLADFRDLGIDFFKLDFLYAGALTGRRHGDLPELAAYHHGLALVREVLGPEPYLLGCGAPILPSVGLVDAMRISPDTAPAYEPSGGDLSRPGQRGAMLTGRARAYMHGRWWVNDADCLLARPEVERREHWAEHVRRWSGLRASSDRLRGLDDWGVETTRAVLAEPPPDRLVPS